MRRDLETRLRKLEGHLLPPLTIPIRYICCDTLEKCEAQQRGMIESRRAEESDDFIFVFAATVNPMLQVI
jgi:hypothetical protein